MSKSFIASTALVLSLTAFTATAQEAPAADDTVTEVVVTGSRAAPRSRLNSLSPVDVIKSDSLNRQGSTELAQALSTLAPALTFPRPSATDGTDNVRPATLRGLSPDQTLVLVNGKRRHTSALVNINGSVGRGSAAVDLNTIPTSALGTIEILRDGASAQYGSDAIAGVVNLRLREAREGGNVTASFGQYYTEVETARQSRDARDGQTYVVSGWKGLPLGEDGFLTVSGELKKRRPTSRGDNDPRVTPASVTSRYGDPAVEDATLFANAGLPLDNGFELYGNAGYQKRESESAAFFRPNNGTGVYAASAAAANIASIYPNGFLPLIGVDTQDYSATGGIRGNWGDWATDLSLTYGRNELDYTTSNSVNASYGTNSKRSFNDGGLAYDQIVLNGSIAKPFDVNGLHGPLNLALGIEARHESFEIKAGEEQSYARGPITAAPLGAQGFGGFLPANAVDVNRDSIGAYIDLEAEVTEKLTVGGAARAEKYSDFGSNLSGKLSARYALNDIFAVRGSVSTGFRAPSLQQQYFTATSTNFTGGVPFETGTFPATSAVARALGASDLKAETSTNYAMGFVAKKGPFELTVDGYQIEIQDRIALTENLGGRADITALLAPYNVTQARFFTNGLDTTTTGIDLVAAYRLSTEGFGRYDFTFSATSANTTIDKLPTNGTLTALTPPPVLLNRIRQYIITNGTPENRASLGLDWTGGAWGVTARANYYGDAYEPAATPADDITTGNKTILDLEGRYTFAEKTTVTLGVNNLLDTYPTATPAYLNSTGTLGFTRFSPFGFNGRYVYARVSHNF
jgi:iron complex outermembrane receptor protein